MVVACKTGEWATVSFPLILQAIVADIVDQEGFDSDCVVLLILGRWEGTYVRDWTLISLKTWVVEVVIIHI